MSTAPPKAARSATDLNLTAQIASLQALERRASNGGTEFEEISIPADCAEVVIARRKMESRLGMKLRSGGVQRQPFIDELDADGLAMQSGLAVGDVICWINGEKVRHTSALLAAHPSPFSPCLPARSPRCDTPTRFLPLPIPPLPFISLPHPHTRRPSPLPQATGANQVADILRTSLKLRLVVRKNGDTEALRRITAAGN
jgi:hypothetical protein